MTPKLNPAQIQRLLPQSNNDRSQSASTVFEARGTRLAGESLTDRLTQTTGLSGRLPPDVLTCAPPTPRASSPATQSQTLMSPAVPKLSDDAAKDILEDLSRNQPDVLVQIGERLLVATAGRDEVLLLARSHNVLVQVQLWINFLDRLGGAIARYRALDANPDTSFNSIYDVMQEIVKIMFHMYRLQVGMPGAIGQRYFNWESLSQLRPLSLLELTATMQVQDEQGQPLPGHSSFFAILAAMEEVDADSQEYQRLERRLHRLRQSLADLPICQAVQQHLNTTKAVHDAADDDIWHRIFEDGDLPAAGRRLQDLHQQAQRLRSLFPSRMIARAFTQSANDEEQPYLDALTELESDFKAELRELTAARTAFIERSKSTSKALNSRQGIKKGYVEAMVNDEVVRLTKSNYHQKLATEDIKWIRERCVSITSILTHVKRFERQSVWSLESPKVTQENVSAAVECLEESIKDKNVSAKPWATILSRGKDLLTIYRSLDEESRENCLLADKVKFFAENTMLYAVLSRQSLDLLPMLRSATQYVAGMASTAISQPISLSTQEDSAGDDAPLAAQNITEDYKIVRELVQIAEDDASKWTTITTRSRASFGEQTLREIDEHFDAGTFSSALRSCLYHFRKHGAATKITSKSLDERAVRGYVEEGIEATKKWDWAQKNHCGYLTPSALDPSVQMRVINHPTMYLVMTASLEAKVVSFRNRKKYQT